MGGFAMQGKVHKLIKKFNIEKNVDLKDAKRIIEYLGFEIVYFAKGDDESKAILKSLGLLDYSETRNAFAYRNEDR